ncbi:MAG: HD domain-containing protein [bacterium]
MTLNREDAMRLLREYTKNENLIKHALAVEASMRAYARKFGEDEEKWGVAGLIHDFDYERYPTMEDHPFRGAEILREKGYPEDVIHAVLSHGDHTGVKRESRMDKALYAVDELTGFIVAVALVRPTKSLMDVEVESVRKKMKDKAFARAVSRDGIAKGAEELGVDLNDHIATVIEAMRGVARELGLE